MRYLELKLPPVVQAALAAALALACDRLLPGPALAAGLARPLGLLLGVVGFAVALAGVVEFRRERTTVDPRTPQRASVLVTGGIYRLTRNPMYLGMLLVLAGWAAGLRSVAAWLPLPLFVLSMNRLQIRPEEQHMLALFGDAYLRYRTRVRRWL